MSLEKKCVTINNYPEYKVSEDGRVFGKYKELKHDITHDGYHRVTLYKDSKPTHIGVHRLVAENFIPNPYNKSTVNHIDGDKNNNDRSNLEWCTRSENSQHAYDHGLNRCHFTDQDRRDGIEKWVKQSSKPVRILETGQVYSSASECARQNNMDSGNIASCCNGNRKTHHGFHFEWAEDL